MVPGAVPVRNDDRWALEAPSHGVSEGVRIEQLLEEFGEHQLQGRTIQPPVPL